MKVCLAALIPLLACLLVLPTVVSARRLARQEEQVQDESEVSHIRKRSMTLAEHFKGQENVQKSCAACRALYEINEENCIAGKAKAKLNCMVKAKGDKATFMAKFSESGGGGGGGGGGEGGGGGGKPQSKEDYFKPEHIQRTCKVCKIIANTNVDECVKPDENHDNKCCKSAFDKLRSKFDEEWEKNPSRHRGLRKRKSRV